VEWSAGAVEALDEYARKVRIRLVDVGADPEEVLGDLREHIERAAQERGLRLLTASDVTQTLDGMGAPEPDAAAPVAGSGVHRKQRTAHLWLGGVVLPAVSLVVQLLTGICTAALEPVPTFLHALLVASVPAAAFLALRELGRGPTPRLARVADLTRFAIGIAALYSILFFPLLPLSIILSFFGVGIMGLSPFFAGASLIALWERLAKLGAPMPRHALLRGLGWAALALLLAEPSVFITSAALHLGDSSNATTERAGLWLLRRFGSEPTMRAAAQRDAFEEGAREASLLLFPLRIFDPLAPSRAEALYYRATGDTANGKPRPMGNRRAFSLDLTRRGLDTDRGTDRVGGALEGLSLAVSRMDVQARPADSLGYIEWTQEFENRGVASAESRAQWRLPEGAVVSRVTLWVNGEPREAAFAATSRVRAAYNDVVMVERRDPLLVTWSGPNSVLVQAFPVLPQQGMRIRIGVTVPLQLAEGGRAGLTLPALVESNYFTPEDFRHQLWVESSASLRTDAAGLELRKGARGFSLRGEVAVRDLAGVSIDVDGVNPSAVRTEHAMVPGFCRAGAACAERSPVTVEQRWIESAQSAPRHLAVVIDGSRPLDEHAREIAALIGTIAPGTRTRVWLASDEPVLLTGQSDAVVEADHVALRERLSDVDFIGGMDNAPSLAAAWDWVEGKPDAELLWIHGPQGIDLKSEESLIQRAERAQSPVRFTALQLAPGPNRALQRLAPAARVESLYGASGLRRVGAELSGARAWRLVRRASSRASAPASAESSHIVRLWARDLIAEDAEIDAASKTRLAVQQQLVTHLSGAVVLETQAQYERHGLEPADPTKVPMIPEPPILLLALIAAVVVGVELARRRRQAWHA
jgi:hypothetical protein